VLFAAQRGFSGTINVEVEGTWEARSLFRPTNHEDSATVRATLDLLVWQGDETGSWLPIATNTTTLDDVEYQWKSGNTQGAGSNTDPTALKVSAPFSLPRYYLGSGEKYRIGVIARLGVFAPISFTVEGFIACQIFPGGGPSISSPP
jgi:hypothetical protein